MRTLILTVALAIAAAVSALSAAAQSCPLQPLAPLGAPGAFSPILDGTDWDPDGNGPLTARPLLLGGHNVAGWAVGSLAVADDGAWRPAREGSPLWLGPVDAWTLCSFQGAFYIGGRGGGIRVSDGSSYVPVAAFGGEGTVSKLFVDGGRLLAVGRFSGVTRILQPGNQMGPAVAANGIAAFDGTQWVRFGTGLTRTVRTARSFGGELLAGEENQVKAWNGSAWRDFGTPFPGSIFQLDVLGGNLYAAGQGSNDSGWVSRWDGQSWVALPDPPGWVRAIAEHQGQIYVAGKRPGLGRAYVARWISAAWELLAEAARDSGNANDIRNSVYTLRSDGDRLLIAGCFADLGGLTGDNIVAYQDGQFRPLGNGFNRSIRTIASVGDAVFASGSFSQIGSMPVPGLAMRDAQGWRAAPSGGPTLIDRIFADGGTLYVLSGSSLGDRIWTLDQGTWTPIAPPPRPGTNGAFAKVGSSLYLATSRNPFTEFFVTTLDRWDGTTWSRVDELARGGVGRMTEFDGMLTIVRSRRLDSGATAFEVAAWNGSDWIILGTFDASPSEMTVYDGEIFVAGNFTQVNGAPIRAFARFDGSTWRSANPSFPNNQWNTVFTAGGQLFASPTGVGLQRWNGAAWEPAAANSEQGFTAAATGHDGSLVFASSYAGTPDGWSYVREFTSPPPATIVAQPTPTTLCVGSTLTLRVTASGPGVLTYRWRKNRVALADGPAPDGSPGVVSGSGTPELRLVGAAGVDSGAYDCVITTDCGIRSFTSRARVVIGQTDVDGDGVRSPADISTFLTWYFAGDPRADFNRDARRSAADVFAFLTAYFAGC